MDDRNRSGRHRGPREMCAGGEWIYGRRPVIEALAAASRRASEVILPPPVKGEAPEVAWIRERARDRGLVIRGEDRHRLDQLTHGGHHQGVALKVEGFAYAEFGDVLDAVRGDERAIVVVLDHLEDPQNVGSVLRTACAVGAAGVIVPQDRAAGITPAVVRASAGASEYLRVARVVNLVRAMKELRDAGMWFTGLDWGEDAKPYDRIDFRGRAGLVVGAEGDGISRLVRDTCDFIAVLPMVGRIASLNAGVAAAVALYEILRQHGA